MKLLNAEGYARILLISDNDREVLLWALNEARLGNQEQFDDGALTDHDRASFKQAQQFYKILQGKGGIRT